MGRLSSSLVGSSFISRSDTDFDPPDSDLEWPFGRLDSVCRDELRETAYELFFAACRSSPGFGGGRNALLYYPASSDGTGIVEGSPTTAARGGGGGVGMVVMSRVKRSLGLRMRRGSPPMMRAVSGQQTANGGANSPGRVRRPMTSAEIMRQQMRVTEQSDNRLRKTLMRTLVGQMGRRAETIILPLELIRQLKPSEFNDAHEYHLWLKRQLKILEVGLLLHPSIPLDRLNSSALCLREIIRSSDLKAIDTSKNCETMRSLCNCVVSLAWRAPNGSPTEVCHWADGFPFNVHLYLSLLHSVFDLRDETVVLDEVDELLELMKKTWTTLGINRMIHNICFAWVLLEQFVTTGQVEPDLLYATLAMLAEVANDAKRADRETSYVKILSATLASMQGWAEKRLLDYHDQFEKGTMGTMENILSLALSVAKIINENIGGGLALIEGENGPLINSSGVRVDYYIRSSLRNAFTRMFENGNSHIDCMVAETIDDDPSEMLVQLAKETDDPSEMLVQLAKETEELAMIEKENFSPILKRWHPVPAAVAVVTLHNCYGVVLKQYLARVSGLTNESIMVLQTAGKLEKVLVEMVVEDSVDCEDGGKGIVREMIPYEVDSIISSLMKTWIEQRIKIGRECLTRAKETESWNPKSKTEPHAQSAVELMKLVKMTIEEFFEIPVGAQDDLVQDLAEGLETLLQDYTSFVASCGSKQSYIPSLPPLTRCNQDSKFLKLWKKASPCKLGADNPDTKNGSADGQHPRPSTSRGTHRLYIRLNTLHYLLSHLTSLDKSLSFFSCSHGPSPTPCVPNSRRLVPPSSLFDLARSSIQTAVQHVSEVAAYRLIFLDSNHSFYDGLYLGDVTNSRIPPALRILKQNLTFLVTVLADRAQPLAVKEVMKASFEVFLMVLLAGGSDRAFSRSDYEMVVEDLGSLKRVFCTSGEGLVAEEVVEREAEVVEAIVGLMEQATEQLVEDFSILVCESSGLGGLGGVGQKLPMPPTTGRWNRGDPNTVLRVLCHRNDDASNHFLKNTFQLAKRR